MELRKMRRFFIIGPMSDVTGRPLENTHNIKRSLERIFRGHGEKIDIKLDIPEELYGQNIPFDVFTAIDLSDLVIADISHRSPNVMYELAFAHALGIHTILIDINDEPSSDPSQPGKKSIFYLHHDRTVRPSSGSAEDIRAALEPLMRNWLKGEYELPSNPLTQFYDVPLVDISAVAGIALGYAENFIVPLMTAIQGPIEQTHDGRTIGNPIAIVVVVPNDLDNLNDEEASVRRELEVAFGRSSMLYQRLIASTSHGKRTVPFYVAGAFIDVPRTLIPLRRPPRVQRLRDHLRKDAWKIMERKLIDAFCRNLRRVAEGSRDISANRLHIVRLPELVNTLRSLS
jgi:hypothetical protein